MPPTSDGAEHTVSPPKGGKGALGGKSELQQVHGLDIQADVKD